MEKVVRSEKKRKGQEEEGWRVQKRGDKKGTGRREKIEKRIGEGEEKRKENRKEETRKERYGREKR